MIDERFYKKHGCYACFLGENCRIDVSINYEKNNADISSNNGLPEVWYKENGYSLIDRLEFEQVLNEARMIVDKAYMSYFIEKTKLIEKEEFKSLREQEMRGNDREEKVREERDND